MPKSFFGIYLGMSLVEEFQNQRAGIMNLSENVDWINLVSSPNCKLIYTPRDNLSSAHELVAQGMKRNSTLHAWC